MSYFSSSVGRKQLMGLSGLAISGFILVHMLGNLIIFKGAEAYNNYAYLLTSNKIFLYAAEIGLLFFFLLHIYLGIRLSLENKKANRGKYAYPTHGDKAAEFASKSMKYQGIVLLAFLIWHLITFKYGTYYEVSYGGIVMRDIFRLVLEIFQNPWYVLGYSVCMITVGIHASHGFSSALQSLGFRHPKYDGKIKAASIGFAILVSVGFLSQPLYVFLQLR